MPKSKKQKPNTGQAKGYLSLLALEALDYLTCSLENLFFVMSLPYGTSMGKALSLLEKHMQEQENGKLVMRVEDSYRRRAYNTLYRLRKHDLITDSGSKISLTARGKAKLFQLRRRDREVTTYAPIPSQELFIVAFDIPEDKRRIRAWMRAVLKNLGFRMLQKSLWVGKSKIPKAFFEEIAEHRLADSVHIFAVSRSGSIEEI